MLEDDAMTQQPEGRKDAPVRKLTDEDIVAIIEPMRARANEQAELIEAERASGMKWYRGEAYGNEREGWAQTVHPTVFSAVEWLKPGLVEVFTGDFFSFDPVVKNMEAKDEASKAAERLKKYIRHKLFVECDGEQIVEDTIHDALTGPYVVLKVSQREEWDIRTAPIAEPTPMAALEQMMEQDETIVRIIPDDVQMVQDPMTGAIVDVVLSGTIYRKIPVYVGPYVEVVPPEELRFTPGYRSLKACPMSAHVVKRDLDYIRRQEMAGVYREGSAALVHEKCTPGGDDSTVKLATTARDYLDGQVRSNDSDDYDALVSAGLALPNTQYEVWECYVRLDLDGSGLLQPAIVTLCGDVVLSGPKPNPYDGAPLEIFSLFKEPHSMRGRGLPHILDSRQRVLTNLLRMIQDGAAISCYRGFITQDALTKKALMAMRPGDVSLVPTYSSSNTTEIRPSAPDPFVLNAFQLTLQETTKESGVNENMQGLDNNSLNKTAHGMEMRMTAGMQRQKLYARRLARLFRNVLARMIDIVRMYPPADDMPLLGEDVVVQPSDLNGRYSVTIDVGIGPQDKQARAGALGQLVGLQLQAGPALSVTPEHILATVKAQYDAIGIDTSAFLPTPEEVATLQQMAAQNQQLLADNQAMSQRIMGQQMPSMPGRPLPPGMPMNMQPPQPGGM